MLWQNGLIRSTTFIWLGILPDTKVLQSFSDYELKNFRHTFLMLTCLATGSLLILCLVLIIHHDSVLAFVGLFTVDFWNLLWALQCAFPWCVYPALEFPRALICVLCDHCGLWGQISRASCENASPDGSGSTGSRVLIFFKKNWSLSLGNCGRLKNSFAILMTYKHSQDTDVTSSPK